MSLDFDILHNSSLQCAFFAWLMAQALKLFFSFLQTRELDFAVLVRLGGIPSAHSAMASALATSVGLRTGLTSAVFAVTFVFAAIVMFDAQSVRRAAGQQARLLNQIVAELLKEHHLSEQKLVEFLGHTRVEVFLGMCMGIAMALFRHAYWGF